MTLALIDEALASGARLRPACDVLGISARTVQRWRGLGPEGGEDRRHGPHQVPANKLPDIERERVRDVANSERFRDLSPKQIVPLLADEGTYVASESTFYRVLAEAGQNAHRQPSKPRSHAKPEERVANGPCQLLCWDITYLPTTVRGRFFYLYLFLDIWSRKVVGWGVHDAQTDEFAAEVLEATCDSLGVCSDGIVLHSDNGKPMKGSTMLSNMQWLGVVPSFSRPHVSDDNPFAEAIFRTLKYRPGATDLRFSTLEEAVAWVQKLIHWYNHEHLHSAIGFVTPADRHCGRDIAMLEGRRRVYKRAHRAHPERWARNVRPWTRPETVRLHPDRSAIKLRSPRQSLSA